MIEIALNDVCINFGFRKILDGVGFEIMTGDKAAIVGSNGSGKTTIFRIIAGLETCDSGISTIRKGTVVGYLEQESDIKYNDITVMEYIQSAQKPIFDIEEKMRNLEQDMCITEDEKSLERILSEYSRLQNSFIAMSGYETGENFSKICAAFKIDESRLMQKCGELSGGQKTIVKMAKTLLQHPDILLLDEPTNHIDITTLQWLEDFIRNYRGTVVIISHDRYFMDKTVSKIISLENGKTEVFAGNYTFFTQEQERLLMEEFEQYKNQQKMIEAMKAAIKRFREWGALGNNKRLFRKADNMEKRLERMEMLDKPKLEKDKLQLDFKTGRRSGKRVLTVRGLEFSYSEINADTDTNIVIFKNADLDVYFRDKICLMGDNGSGKTTFINLALNQIENYCGSITIGESVKIGYIEQEIKFPNEKETVLEAFRNDAKIMELEARRILGKYFFTHDDVYKRLEILSGGERVILKLSMLMQKEINFLILDEPTNHLDIDAKEMLEEALSSYKGTLLFISHDRYFINKIAERIAYIDNKSFKCYEGNYDYYVLQKNSQQDKKQDKK